MSVTETCRDLSQLSKPTELACRLLFQECYKAGITDIFITETYRSPARQKYLYAQGRTRPGQIVTWTLNSNHSGRLAWDIAVGPPQSLYDVTTLNKVGAIARKLGITWGGDWENNMDRPHFEVKANWTIPNGYKLEGQVIVPSNSKLKVQLIVKDETKEADTLAISSPTLKVETEVTLSSKARRQLIVDEAVKVGATKTVWQKKLDDGTITDGDLLALAAKAIVDAK